MERQKIELKQLACGMLGILGCDMDYLSDALQQVVLSGQADHVMDQYIKLVDGDLETDYLQKIYQYYHADRKEKCQDFTPSSIARLVSALTGSGKVVYDCCAGSGALTIQEWRQCPDAEYICEELDAEVVPYLLFNMSVRNIFGWVVNRNVLTLETTAVYRLRRGARYSNIEIADEAPEIKADCAISNPPYNISWSPPDPLLADERFQHCEIPPKGNANYAFVLTAISRLKPNGRCAFVLPNSVLSQNGETDIRKYLIESGRLEQVILLPDRMFEATAIPTCVMVFGHSDGAVRMYDCRQRGTTEIREQRGQYGGASHEGRTYHKEIITLSEELIGMLCTGCEDEPGFSRQVPIEEIAANDWNLTPARYIEIENHEAEHRAYGDIIADINRICRERNVIRITVNETIARQLGLAELHELEQQSNQIAEDMQKTFDLFGERVIQSDYLRLSRNKEFKIENQDKELLSSLLSIFIPMWRQHMYYLNQEENRYLAELRDALLPDLMSGKIEI